ncbi:GlyGly-CTERM sorting domain-containing protein, partial [Vibrio natriegens]
SRYIIAPEFITDIEDGNTDDCNDGIATNNCNFRDTSDGGGSLNFGFLSLLGLLAWRRQQNT